MEKYKNISGIRIAEARKHSNPKITQHELSRLLFQNGTKLGRATLAKIEAGLRGVLDYELLAISNILEVRLDWLLEGSPVESTQSSPAQKSAEIFEETASTDRDAQTTVFID